MPLLEVAAHLVEHRGRGALERKDRLLVVADRKEGARRVARALAREKTLDDVEAALGSPDPQAAIAKLKDRLDDSAAALIPLPADARAAIQAERVAMRARFLAESDAANTRMRWLIIIVTTMSAIFGTAITGFGRRG